ncbi:MAG: voltage-gated potassium channel [Alteromonadaceae bacterium]|jgi:voltage-gated potassium channel
MMKYRLKTHAIDEFGVKNYHTFFLVIMTLIVLYSIIALLSFALVQAELSDVNSNIKTYRDAFWTLQMSASTIGFGDFYPVTIAGRFIVAAMFYIGVGMVGYVGAQFVNKFVSFSDTNVKNRELRSQNREILANNKLLEQKVDLLLAKVEEVVKRQ